MRSTSIPKTVEAALNDLFDNEPHALAALLDAREARDSVKAKLDKAALEVEQESALDALEGSTKQLTGSVVARELRPDETIGLLDVVNAILAALAPGKKLSTIHGLSGLEGFVLARDRKPKAEPVDGIDYTRIAREQAYIDNIAAQ